MILALEDIHSKGVLHRDIKPENIVFDSNGYLRLTDFGISRFQKKENSSETSGTPGYMAPEVICRQNHGPECDYFAVGVIAYELVTGTRPYKGINRKEIRDNMLSKQAVLRAKDIPYSGMSELALDFINQLLQRKVSNRLGSRLGVIELKKHLWFHDFPWRELKERLVRSPYCPNFLERDIGYGEKRFTEERVLPEQPTEEFPSGSGTHLIKKTPLWIFYTILFCSTRSLGKS